MYVLADQSPGDARRQLRTFVFLGTFSKIGIDPILMGESFKECTDSMSAMAGPCWRFLKDGRSQLKCTTFAGARLEVAQAEPVSMPSSACQKQCQTDFERRTPSCCGSLCLPHSHRSFLSVVPRIPVLVAYFQRVFQVCLSLSGSFYIFYYIVNAWAHLRKKKSKEKEGIVR